MATGKWSLQAVLCQGDQRAFKLSCQGRDRLGTMRKRAVGNSETQRTLGVQDSVDIDQVHARTRGVVACADQAAFGHLPLLALRLGVVLLKTSQVIEADLRVCGQTL